MSKKMPLIVYAGEEQRGRYLQQMTASLGWTVLTATGEHQALGMYVFYVPDLVIIDSRHNEEGANTILFHLHSVQAQPILLLVEPRHKITIPSGIVTEVIPSATEDSKVVLAATELLQMAASLQAQGAAYPAYREFLC